MAFKVGVVMAEYLKFNNVIYEALLRKLKPAFKQWLETYFDQSKIETDWKLIRVNDYGTSSFDIRKYLDAEFFEAIKRSNPEALTEREWSRLRSYPEEYEEYQTSEVQYLHDPDYERRLDHMCQKLEDVLIERGLISLEDSWIEDDIDL